MDKLIRLVLEAMTANRMDTKTGSDLIAQIKNIKIPTTQDIAIIGMSCRFPMAENIEVFWKNIAEGIDCITAIPENRKTDSEAIRAHSYLKHAKGTYSKGGYLNDIDTFDYAFFKLTASEAALMDPNQRLFLETAWSALEDAGYIGERRQTLKVGIYVGSNSPNVYGQIVSMFHGDNPDAIIGNLSSMTPTRLAYHLDLHGPAILMDTACSSALVALHTACRAVSNGDCDMAIVGGVNIRMLSIEGEWEFGTDASDYATKTFDEAADGTAWGEGVGALVIRPIDKAIRAHDRIYATIKGSAVNQDGRSVGITAPNVKAQENMLIEAWENNHVNPETITYIETHGTGTKLGDPIEIQALKNAFERYTKKKQFCAVGAVKSNIGHLDGVSGIAGIIKAVMALRNKQIPPTLHFQLPNNLISFEDSPFYVNAKTEDWDIADSPRRCGVNSFGLSGTNCHVILEEYIDPKNNSESSNEGYGVLTLSAMSMTQLQMLISNFKVFLQNTKKISWLDICFTASAGRDHYRYRIMVLASSIQDAAAKLGRIGELNPQSMPKDTWYGDIRSITKEILRHNKDQDEKLSADDRIFWQELSRKYITGENINWGKIYSNQYIIGLPPYIFDRTRCWIEPPQPDPSPMRNLDIFDNILYETAWITDEQPNRSKTISPDITVFVNGETSIAKSVADELKNRGQPVMNIDLEGPDSIDEYRQVFDSLKANDQIQILYFVGKHNNHREIKSLSQLEADLQAGVYGFFRLTKGLFESSYDGKVEIVIIANIIHKILPDDKIIPENAALAGLGKVINFENTLISARCIDIDDATTALRIIEELSCEDNLYFTALRNGEKYVEQLRPSKNQLSPDPIEIRANGTYVITGGLGGIGLEIGKWICKKANVNLIFLNRTPMPPQEQWEELLHSGQDKKIVRQIQAIKEIESCGSSIECISVDIADLQQVSDAIVNIKNMYGHICGVIHGAGVAGDGFLVNKDEETLKKVLYPKVYGTWVINEATKQEPLDFFLMFSSGTALFGDPGQGDYMAANAYLDAYVYAREGNGRTMTVSWTGWKETGMAKDNNVNIDATFIAMPTNLALSGFANALERDFQHLLIGKLNKEQITYEQLDNLQLPFTLAPEIIESLNQKGTKQEVNLPDDLPLIVLEGDDGHCREITQVIAQAWGAILGGQKFHIQDNFFELGGNSIKAVQVAAKLPQYRLDIKEIIQNPTIELLAQSICNKGIIDVDVSMSQISSEKASVIPPKTEYIVEGVTPFNDALFKDCFYNAFFAAVSFLGVDIHAFMLYDFSIYRLNKTQNDVDLDISYITLQDIRTIAKRKGIEVETHNGDADTIMDKIKEALCRDQLAIVRTDAFFEPIRVDTYQQLHWAHALLLFGYDDAKEHFHIFEHENMNSLSYRHQVLGYKELSEARQGYLDHFHQALREPSLYTIGTGENLDKKTFSQAENLAIYKEGLLSVWDKVTLNIEHLSQYQQYYANLEGVFEKFDQLKYTLSEILKVKSFEKYRFNFMGITEEKFIKLIDMSIKIITSISFQIESGKVKNKETMNSEISEKVAQLLETEKEYVNALYRKFIQ